jgi:hypothetical protein
MIITIFAGEHAEARARDYHDAIRDGRLDSHVTDAQRGGSAQERRKRA